MIPKIKELIFNLADSSSLNSNEYLDDDDNDNIYESEENILLIEIDNNDIISDITKKNISIKNPLNTIEVLKKVKDNIYDALLFYWDVPNDSGIIASLLDPRYKELDFLEIDEKKYIIQKLRNELEINNTSPVDISSNLTTFSDTEFSLRSQKEYRQYHQMKHKKQVNQSAPTIVNDEISNYLAMPIALENENSLDWWQARVAVFPKLLQLARKYLGISVSFVSSE
ncbi:658_t:CDS:1, partial [Scutellospora calospora]